MIRRTLYRADWVLPITAPPIRAGAVLVGTDGRIEAVGATGDVAPHGAEIVDLGPAALLPGLVNTHAHPELTLFRGRIEDLPFQQWIATLLRLKGANPDHDYALAARWGLAEALAAGITTLAATEDSAATFDALLECGMRGIVYQETFGPDPVQADTALAALRDRVAALRARATGLVRIGVSPHAPFSVSDALFRHTAEYARAEELPVAAHVAESHAETRLVAHGDGPFAAALGKRGIATPIRARSTVELLDRLGVLRTRPLLVHCVRVDDADLGRIADAGASIAHCPTANARLGHGVAPLPALLARGIRVGLGSDSMASNNRMDMLEEARAAQLVQRATRLDPELVDAGQLLRLATLDGARALGIDGIGALEPGLDADLAAFRLDRPHTLPVHDPAAALVHAARGSDALLTIVRGRVLYRDGVWTTLDVDALRERVRAVRLRAPEPVAAR